MRQKCKVLVDGEECEAILYGIFQKAYTHSGGLTIGSEPAGQVAYPVAVVDCGGGLKEVKVTQIKELEE